MSQEQLKSPQMESFRAILRFIEENREIDGNCLLDFLTAQARKIGCPIDISALVIKLQEACSGLKERGEVDSEQYSVANEALELVREIADNEGGEKIYYIRHDDPV